MKLIPISQFVLRQAETIRITNLKTPDAIHAATALTVNYTQFITNDKAFRNVSSLPVVVRARSFSILNSIQFKSY